MSNERKRRTGVLVALALLAASGIIALAMNDATSALACCGGGGW